MSWQVNVQADGPFRNDAEALKHHPPQELIHEW
jgi:hypothetical protein